MSQYTDKPLVSVIIPFYKRNEFTMRAIDSVLSQTYKNIEIILINDGTPEDDFQILEIVNQNENIIYIKLVSNIGPSGARNIGIEKSKGKYIAFLDSDDTWENEKLSIQIKEMEEKKWKFSHTSYYRHHSLTKKSKIVNSGNSFNIYPLIAFHCSIVTPSVVIAKDVLQRYSFNPELRIGEDVLLWLELSKKIKIHGINEPLTHVYLGHQDHVKDLTIKERGLYIIGKEAFSDNIALYFIHKVYYLFRVLVNKVLVIYLKFTVN